MNKAMMIGALALLSNMVVAADYCASADLLATNPDHVYDIKDDGTVIDKRTNLMWKRCAEGQVFSGGVCTGSVTNYSDSKGIAGAWQTALSDSKNTSLNYSDWRLPNAKELATLVEYCGTNWINATVFPNATGGTTGVKYLSNSFHKSRSPYAELMPEYFPPLTYTLDADTGTVSALSDMPTNFYAVRLVRDINE